MCVCLGALEKKTNIKLTKASAGVIVKNVSEIKNKIEVEKPQIKSLQTINWNLNLKMYVKKNVKDVIKVPLLQITKENNDSTICDGNLKETVNTIKPQVNPS